VDEGERLELSGKLDQAIEAYVRGKRWEHAARVAGSLGKNLDAGRYWLEAKKPFEAAVCFRRVGALRECQQALMYVPANHPRYREACVHLVTVAQILGTPTASLMTFVAPFLSSVPSTRAEATALNALAEQLTTEEKFRLAQSLYKSVLAWENDNDDARDGLLKLAVLEKEAAARPSAPPPPAGTGARPAVPRPQPSAPTSRPKSAALGDALVARGRIQAAELEAFVKSQPRAQGNDAVLAAALVEGGKVTAQDMIQTQAELSGIPWISDEKLLAGASPDAGKALTLEQAEKWNVAPIRLQDRHLHVAMRDPRDVELLDKLRFASGARNLTGIFATDYGIRRAIAKVYHGVQGFQAEGGFGELDPATAGTEVNVGFADKFTKTREHQFDTGELTEAMIERPATPMAGGDDSMDLLPPPGEMNLPPPSGSLSASTPAPFPAARSGDTVELPPRGPLSVPELGSVFAKRYEMQALLGEGGSALVFKAQDRELSEPVALKLFRSSGQAETEDVISRYKLELSLSRLLTHPNIIRLFDLGFSGGWRYLTMELLEGKDLYTRLTETGRPIPLAQGLGWLEQVCAGLGAAHERGVIHRDIKPHNLFVTHDGTVKVMDFGIAKKMHSPGVTQAGMVRGTPEFISPEQITNFSSVSHLTDLYALGATAFMIFTGSPPFVADELTALLYAQANTPAPSPRVRNPEIPEGLENLILRLLEKNPQRRPQSAADVGAVLKSIREALPK
jgi:eukaryotic-like serine/threonine-protein kinase